MNAPAPVGTSASRWPFDPLPPLSFDMAMVDPPWLYELRSEKGIAKAPQAQYACMPTAEIAALPVSYLMRGDGWLWLWTTFPMLLRGDAHVVMKAWGFTPVTGGVWIKRGHSGKLAMGPGYVLRGNAEPFLIGRIGEPRTFSRSIRNVIEAPRRRHSEKPTAAYEAAEILFGPGRRADLFSRRTRPGWESWGREAGKFDAAPPLDLKSDRDTGREIAVPAIDVSSFVSVPASPLLPFDIDERRSSLHHP